MKNLEKFKRKLRKNVTNSINFLIIEMKHFINYELIKRDRV